MVSVTGGRGRVWDLPHTCKYIHKPYWKYAHTNTHKYIHTQAHSSTVVTQIYTQRSHTQINTYTCDTYETLTDTLKLLTNTISSIYTSTPSPLSTQAHHHLSLHKHTITSPYTSTPSPLSTQAHHHLSLHKHTITSSYTSTPSPLPTQAHHTSPYTSTPSPLPTQAHHHLSLHKHTITSPYTSTPSPLPTHAVARFKKFTYTYLVKVTSFAHPLYRILLDHTALLHELSSRIVVWKLCHIHLHMKLHGMLFSEVPLRQHLRKACCW